MKINLLTKHCSKKTKAMAFLLFIVSTLFPSQTKKYAYQQENNTNALLCLGCGVENPENAVDANEDTYSTLKLNAGVVAGVEQTLLFEPTTKMPGKLVIGIGTESTPLFIELLGSLTVETGDRDLLGTKSNVNVKTISNSILKVSSQDQKRATIELDLEISQFSYAKITLLGGLLTLTGGLRIYYAYYTEHTSMCPPPHNPVHYYPFDGTTYDHAGNFDLTRTSIDTELFKPNMICGQGLGYSTTDPTYTFKGKDYLNVPFPRAPRMVSFWAQIDQGGYIDLTIYGEKVKITPDSIIIKPVNENHSFQKSYFGRMFRRNPATSGRLNLYTINFNNDPTPPYSTSSTFYIKNNAEVNPPYYPVDVYPTVNGNGLPGPFLMFAGSSSNNYPTIIYTTHWDPYYTKGVNLMNNEFSISFKRAQLDEFLIYDKKVDPKLLFNTYPQNSNGSSILAKTSFQIESKTLAVSPNPTTGQITIDGDIPLTGSDISIRNASGMEVYHSAFKTKTFELPANLPGGIYILTLQTKDQKVYTRKIILTR